jgi:hypothetical protein
MIYFIACSATKLDRAAPACDLYQGQAFKAARKLAEKSRADYWILSAKHGLIHPDTVTEPYNDYLGAMTKAQRNQWGAMVCEQIKAAGLTSRAAVILAGKHYAAPVSHLFPTLSLPLAGLGIGQQLSKLKQLNQG